MQHIPALRPISARVVTPLIKKLRKGEPQTFDRLPDDEITTLETLKANFVEPPVLALPRFQDDYTVETGHEHMGQADWPHPATEETK